MVSEGQYFEAKEHPEIRQLFLNRIYFDSRELKKYVRELLYIESNVQGLSMFVDVNYFSKLYIPRIRQNILVLPYAFSEKASKNLDDFLSVLIDHELFHAKRLFEQPWNFKPSTGLEEYLAYKNQVDNFLQRNCSPEVQETTKIALYFLSRLTSTSSQLLPNF
jgi:hypothetical protein